MSADRITLALPSKGAIAEPTYNFLKNCGLKVNKPNPRQYTGTIPSLTHVDLLFQRVKDVAYKVADGTAQIGITGFDVVEEYSHDDLIIIHPQLGYGHCSLVMAVPESWVDVETIHDLVDVAHDFREIKQRNIRIATTYTTQTRQFLHKIGIHHFTLVKAEGAIEAAPTIGYADFVVDLTQTGTTLRENHLKTIAGGTILESQACLIGNRDALFNNRQLLKTLRQMLEQMDAAIVGRKYYQLTANMSGANINDIGKNVVENALTAGLQGPTIAQVYSNTNDDTNWYSVTITVHAKDIMKAVEHLRSIGGRQIITTPVEYVFFEESSTFVNLVEQLKIAL